MADADETIAHDRLDARGRQVEVRREQLHEATRDLAATLEDTSEELADRLAEVRRAVADTRTTIDRHVREAEASDGLLAQIITEQPAFGARAEEMRREHIALLEESAELVEASQAARSVDELRDGATELIELIQRHRHRSAELLLDTYDLDLSAND